MFNKLNQLFLVGYMRMLLLKDKAVQELHELRDDERGLSGVVVAVLLILVAVLAVVLLWGQLKGWLSTTWATITGKAGEIA